MIIQHQEERKPIGFGTVSTVESSETHARIEDGTYFYLKSLSPMAAQKAADALRRVQNFNGKPMSRAAWVLANFNNIDRIENGRIYMKSGSFYLINDVTKTVADFIEYLNSCV